jgi:hypothetical protein
LRQTSTKHHRIAEVCENFDGGFLAFDKWLWFVEAHLQAER